MTKLVVPQERYDCYGVISSLYNQYNSLPLQPASKAKDFIVMTERLTSVVAKIHEGIMKANSINDPDRFARLSLVTSTPNICKYVYTL